LSGNKALLITAIMIFLMLITSVFAKGLEADKIESIMIEHACELNEMKIKNDSRLTKNDLATNEQIENRVGWLKYYSKRLAPKGYNWKRLWKDSFAIAWQESYFVNYIEHDNNKGFGWTALHWTTCEDMADRYGWNWQKDKDTIDVRAKLQAKYMIGYVVWLYDFYGQDRRKAITGYNQGLWLDDDFYYKNYWLSVAGRINQVDKWLEVE